MTRVAILWHMHQPFYEDLVTGEHVLPWVRLHALKDYYGMAAILREFPGVKMTFNLVPSLLVQLEAFADNRARDRYLELSLKPAANLDEGDIGFILENFFHAQRQRMIEAYPRYAELLARRGGPLPTSGDRRTVEARFRCGTNSSGSTRFISSVTRASKVCWPKDATSPRRTKRCCARSSSNS